MDDSSVLRNVRQYALVYNQLSENCFQNCISRMSDRNLSTAELQCVDTCAEKLIKASYRINFTAAEIGPMGGARTMS